MVFLISDPICKNLKINHMVAIQSVKQGFEMPAFRSDQLENPIAVIRLSKNKPSACIRSIN